ncbi:MAG: Uma2 family endonuclease [Planctomycetota bacterium]
MPTATTVTAVRSRSRHRVWTYADYCRIPEDRQRHEIIDGRHYVTPAPSVGHQEASAGLTIAIGNRVRAQGLGRVLAAPLDVHLGRGTVVQPDLVVVMRSNLAVIGDKKITGAPDLVVEILSPSTSRRDRRLKKARYQRAGVREFWIVDTKKKMVKQFVLRDGRYGRAVVCKDRVRLHIVRGVSIDLAKVW